MHLKIAAHKRIKFFHSIPVQRLHKYLRTAKLIPFNEKQFKTASTVFENQLWIVSTVQGQCLKSLRCSRRTIKINGENITRRDEENVNHVVDGSRNDKNG